MRRQWLLWLFSGVVFMLYAAGTYDFWLIARDSDEYILQQFGNGGQDYFSNYPLGLRLLWAVNLACGLAAPLVAVGNHRGAASIAMVCVAAQLLLLGLTFGFRGRWEALGAETAAWDGVITAISVFYTVFLWCQVRAMDRSVSEAR